MFRWVVWWSDGKLGSSALVGPSCQRMTQSSSCRVQVHVMQPVKCTHSQTKTEHKR
jgi:hypothetical protein